MILYYYYFYYCSYICLTFFLYVYGPCVCNKDILLLLLLALNFFITKYILAEIYYRDLPFKLCVCVTDRGGLNLLSELFDPLKNLTPQLSLK